MRIQHLPSGVFPRPQRKDDRIPLVALNSLQVLYKEGVGALVKEPVHVSFGLEPVAKRRINPSSVGDSERDYAKRFRRSISRVFDDEIDDAHNLGVNAVGAVSRCARHLHVTHAGILLTRARKCHEAPAVNLVVGKRNEAFVAASVVPLKRPGSKKARHLVQEALVALHHVRVG